MTNQSPLRDRRLRLAARTLLLIALSAGAVAPAWAADEEERFVVIRAGKIIPVVGKEITDGVIVIVNGKIRNVGKGLEYPANARVIDASDQTVMPGLINPYTRFGLPNYDRAGVHGNYAVADENIPSKSEYDELLAAGFTTVGLYAGGNGIPGRALVTRTAGPAAQRVLVGPGYLRMLADKTIVRGAFDRAQQEIDKVEKAKKDFEEQQKKQAPPPAQPPPQSAPAQPNQPQPTPGQPPQSQPASQPASAPAKPEFKAPPIDPAHQALVDLIQKKEGLFALIELRGASEYLHMADVLKKYPVAHSFVVRNTIVSDFFRVADKLGEEKARVICYPLMNRIPLGTAERVPTVAMLSRAGCEVSITPLNDSPDEYRRVFERVAELVRDGWTRDEAFKSLTLNPAKLLGLDARLGSIEKDKEADLIILDGDPLKQPGATVRKVVVLGEVVYTAAEIAK